MDINNEENQYFNLLERFFFKAKIVMIEQELEPKNVFGAQLKFNLRHLFRY